MEIKGLRAYGLLSEVDVQNVSIICPVETDLDTLVARNNVGMGSLTPPSPHHGNGDDNFYHDAIFDEGPTLDEENMAAQYDIDLESSRLQSEVQSHQNLEMAECMKTSSQLGLFPDIHPSTLESCCYIGQDCVLPETA